MRIIEIPEANVKRYIPSDLSECDQQQYMDICELIFYFQNEQINYDEFRTHAVYKLMKMVPSKKDDDDEEKFANIYQLSELIDDFFDTDKEGKKIIKQDYINNPIPSFKPIFKTLYGPSDSFMNMTFGEYTDALRLFLDFHATGDMELLKLLTAVFYREKKAFHFIKKYLSSYNGDIRVPYNSKLLEVNAKELKHAPIGFVYGFYLLFASFQKYLIDAKIMWGGKEIDLAILFENNGSDSNETPSEDIPGIGMDSIAFSIAESGTFGNIDQVRNTNFWDIMIRMYDLRRTDLERQKHENNASTK
ncbi:hypothetical protein [Flavobacterium granuli]|uniref:Uncharacterized protein n=1 Tax=Flavobacterium granuli TaxID=280093 RepID=A0ABU1S0H2_9FLAO|nr:hypothetical protein [Flavobacterium granuli]MDR6844528.1 hypothetical protein [Flavobacterium granuli]